MMKRFIEPLLFLSLFALIACQGTGRENYTLERGKNFEGGYPLFTFVEDLDENGRSELISVKRNPQDFEFRIVVMDMEMERIYHIESLWAWLMDVKAYDVTGDGHKEIVYTYLKGDSLFLKVYQPLQGGKVVAEAKIKEVKRIRPNTRWNGIFQVNNVADLNHDGYTDLILTIMAASDLYPRCIIGYDVVNKAKLWTYDLAPTVHKMFVKDLNGDGKTDLFFYTGSFGSEVKTAHTDDLHSYFIILDDSGQVQFIKQMGDLNTSTVVFFARDPASQKELLYTLTYSRSFKTFHKYQLVRWDYSDWPNLKPEIQNTSLPLRFIPEVLNYKGMPRIFVSNIRDELCMLDLELNLLRVFSFPQKVRIFKGLFDLTGDGIPESVWYGSGKLGVIMNDNLQPIFNLPSFQNIFEVRHGPNGPVNHVVLTTNGDMYEISLKHTPMVQFLFRRYWLWGFLGLLLSNIALWVFFVSRSGNWKWYHKHLTYLDASLSAMFLLDSQGRVISCNKKAESLLHRPSEQMLNTYVVELFQGSMDVIGKWLAKRLSKLQTDRQQFEIKEENARRTFQVYFQIIQSRFGLIEGAILIVNDVTLMVQSQQTTTWLTVAQKMAHEIKNPLTTIQLTLQRLKYEYEMDPNLRTRVGEVVEGSLEEIGRMRMVLDDFMNFSKIEKTQFEQLDIRQIITEVVDRYNRKISPGVAIKTEFSEYLPMIKADAAQIITLLTNLIDNSLDAIRAPGEITIRVNVIEKILDTSSNPLAEHIELEIVDTGCGMDDETMQKIFRPFFTTKEGGSGLGLSIVQKIVQGHGGEITVSSKKNVGTRIVIHLPIIDMGAS